MGNETWRKKQSTTYSSIYTRPQHKQFNHDELNVVSSPLLLQAHTPPSLVSLLVSLVFILVPSVFYMPLLRNFASLSIPILKYLIFLIERRSEGGGGGIRCRRHGQVQARARSTTTTMRRSRSFSSPRGQEAQENVPGNSQDSSKKVFSCE